MGVCGEMQESQVTVSDFPDNHVNVIAVSLVRGRHGTLAIGRLGCLC